MGSTGAVGATGPSVAASGGTLPWAGSTATGASAGATGSVVAPGPKAINATIPKARINPTAIPSADPADRRAIWDG